MRMKDYSEFKGGIQSQKQPWPGAEKKLRPLADHGEETYKGSDKLKDCVAIITGGDSGIGRAVAIAYAREGCDVVIAYYNETEDAQATAHWVEEAGRRALLIEGDISDCNHCRDIVHAPIKNSARSIF
jgi:hypothetical protein